MKLRWLALLALLHGACTLGAQTELAVESLARRWVVEIVQNQKLSELTMLAEDRLVLEFNSPHGVGRVVGWEAVQEWLAGPGRPGQARTELVKVLANGREAVALCQTVEKGIPHRWSVWFEERAGRLVQVVYTGSSGGGEPEARVAESEASTGQTEPAKPAKTFPRTPGKNAAGRAQAPFSR